MSLADIEGELQALICGKASKYIKGKLDALALLLKHKRPSFQQAVDSSVECFSFDSFNCDIFNRYAQDVSGFIYLLVHGLY